VASHSSRVALHSGRVAPHALAVFGITGRMGQSLIRALREGSQFKLKGAVASAASPRLGLDAAAEGEATGVMISADPDAALEHASVALDFSLGSAVAAHARACAKHAVPLLVGATGFDAPAKAELERAASEIAVLIAPNTSVGVAVLNQLAAEAARALGAAYEVDIAEAHHRGKRDAPSGTALALGEAIAQVRAVALSAVAVYGPGSDALGEADAARKAGAVRKPGSIGFSVVREGDIVGEHTVAFTGAGEKLELTHRACDRITFARGALRGAAWLIGRPAGLYGMKDVLGL
jgi:4-hydroxy-tetrahydrodipicolinate reductase